jgi:DNA-binding MarR family transcriptional regulator
MKSKTTDDGLTGPKAVKIIGSIFRVRRDLVPLIKRKVMPGMGLTLEQADLLLDLYGARRLGWPDPKAIEGGWVTFAALKASLVHARELLTRRLSDLEEGGYVEIISVPREEAKALGIDSKSKKVRILPKGEEKAKEIYDRYGRACLDLINRLPAEQREQAETILRFNEAVMKALRW